MLPRILRPSVKEDPVNRNPVAIFDSGLGGLSVVRQIRHILPAEDIVYFGDTARVPYGSKSRPTVVTFALELARFLLQFEPKLMVAACNTASALAMDELTAELPLPVVGVVEPGARAAVELADGGAVCVLGTEATIESGAYPRAIRALDARVEVISRACPLLVPLVEEGRRSDDAIVRAVIEDYLAPLRQQPIRVVVLGCTHYPLLRQAIVNCLGCHVYVVDSGRETSLMVERVLSRAGCLSRSSAAGSIRCCVSDNPARFCRIGSSFLNEEITHVELIGPERYVSSAVAEAEFETG
jgi:glutamate racemase